eukprot:3617856-Rhodomonas_salina.1
MHTDTDRQTDTHTRGHTHTHACTHAALPSGHPQRMGERDQRARDHWHAGARQGPPQPGQGPQAGQSNLSTTLCRVDRRVVKGGRRWGG